MANQRLNAKIQIGASVDKTVGRALSGIQSSLKKVGHEIRDVEKAQKDLGKQRDVLIKQGRSVEDLDREYADLGRTLDRLRDKQRRLERAMLAGRRVGETFNGAGTQIGRSARTVGIGIAAASATVIGLTRGVAELGDNSAKTADKLGMNVEALQELRYAAERSGVSSNTLDMAMQRMTRRVSEAARGTGEAKDALKEMGLSAEALTKMAPEDAIAEISDAMAKVPGEADRVRLAMRLFDSEGVGLVNMLGNGSGALSELREAARATGYVLSEDAARGAEKYQDAMLDAKLSMLGLRNTIGAALMPAVTELTETFSSWLQANNADVKEWAEAVGDAAQEVVPIVGEVAAGFGDVASAVRDATSVVVGAVGGWRNFGIVLGGVFASRTILAIGSFGMAVGKLSWALMGLVGAKPMVVGALRAIGAAIRANPIGAAVSVVAGAALLIIDNWETIRPKLQPVFDWLGRAGDTIGEGWKRFGDLIGSLLDGVVAKFEWAKEKIGAIVEWFDKKVQQVKAVGQKIGDWVSSAETTDVGGAGADRSYLSIKDGGPIPQRRAVGGSFKAGPLVVGEGGSELMYPSRGGFIAHARHTQRLAGLARSAAQNLSRPASRAGDGRPVSITINQAPGQSADELVRIIERRLSRRSGALFDGGFA